MTAYCIVETEDGLSILHHGNGMNAEETAQQFGGTLVDSGPFDSYDEAFEALEALLQEVEGDDFSDVPGTQAMESRPEPAE